MTREKRLVNVQFHGLRLKESLCQTTPSQPRVRLWLHKASPGLSIQGCFFFNPSTERMFLFPRPEYCFFPAAVVWPSLELLPQTILQAIWTIFRLLSFYISTFSETHGTPCVQGHGNPQVVEGSICASTVGWSAVGPAPRRPLSG